MLQIKDLSKTYNKTLALDGVTLDIPNGGVFALLGVNGAGKTTLVSILCNTIKADRGEILYAGEPFFDILKKDSSLCSLTPQEFAFYPTLSVWENIDFFSHANNLTRTKRKEMIDFSLSISKLENYLKARADMLSGGLKRRLNLAISLLNDPKILFLDEPTVGIDPRTREFILDSIKELSKGKRIIVYTSHHMNEIDFLADRGAIIDKGKILTTFESSKNKAVLTIELKYPNEKNIQILNEFIPFKAYKKSLINESLEEDKISEFLKFSYERGIEFKKILFAPLSIETLFLSLTDKELL